MKFLHLKDITKIRETITQNVDRLGSECGIQGTIERHKKRRANTNHSALSTNNAFSLLGCLVFRILNRRFFCLLFFAKNLASRNSCSDDMLHHVGLPKPTRKFNVPITMKRQVCQELLVKLKCKNEKILSLCLFPIFWLFWKGSSDCRCIWLCLLCMCARMTCCKMQCEATQKSLFAHLIILIVNP